jgi:hypothetical protein
MVDWTQYSAAVLLLAFILPVCANQHANPHGGLVRTGHTALKRAFGGGNANSAVARTQPKSMAAFLNSHKINVQHPLAAHKAHQLEVKLPALIKQHAKTAAGVGALAKIDSAKPTKATATKQYSISPLHKDGQAIESPVKWEGFNPRHASEILEV